MFGLRLSERSAPTRRLVLVAAVCAAGFGGYQSYRAWAAGSARRAALAAYTAGNLSDARRRLAAVLADAPDDGEANLLMARAARRDGDFTTARRFLDRAKEAGWEADAVALERTLLDAQTGDFRWHEGRILEWARLDTDDLPLFVEVLVPVYLQRHDLGLALELLTLETAKHPSNAQAHAWLAETYERLGQVDKAIDAAAAATAAAPDRPAPAALCGRLLLEFNRAPEALPHLERATALAPTDRPARFALARCKYTLGDLPAATALLDELLAEQPSDPMALIARAQAAAQAGDPAAAEGFLTRALAVAPAELEALTAMADVQARLGRPAEAQAYRDRHDRAKTDLAELTEATRAVTRDPRNPEPRYKAGMILLRNGFRDAGVRWLESALAEQPQHGPTLKALADARAKK